MSTNLEIKIISYNSDEYQQAIQLRYKILREPLGLQFSAADLHRDKNEIIIGIFYLEQIIGVLQLQTVNKEIVQLRQMAIETAYQHKGFGKQIVDFSEEIAREKGFREIILHARKVAVKFYKKLGYKTVGPEFTEVGIPHFKMYKKLGII